MATGLPVLLRVAELGPPPEPVPPPSGWRSPLLAGLPVLRPAPAKPVLVQPPPVVRPVRPAVTDAQARGMVNATARAVLEALEGRRPMHQLTGVLNERALGAVQTMRRGGLRWPVRRAAVVSVHVALPCRDAIEACVVFRCDQRCRAMALRLELVRRQWIGTAVRIG